MLIMPESVTTQREQQQFSKLATGWLPLPAGAGSRRHCDCERLAYLHASLLLSSSSSSFHLLTIFRANATNEQSCKKLETNFFSSFEATDDGDGDESVSLLKRLQDAFGSCHRRRNQEAAAGFCLVLLLLATA